MTAQRDPLAFIAEVAPAALCNPPTLVNTLELCQRAIMQGVPGDFVECGVFKGAHPAIMSRVLLDSGEDERRMVHLFDSFEGIQESGPRDDHTITDCIGVGQNRLRTTGVSSASAESVKEHLDRWGVYHRGVKFWPGWVQHTLPGAAAWFHANLRPIAVLRIDVDVYEATRTVLRYLEPCVPVGGFIIVDDYALTGCRAACDDHYRDRSAVRVTKIDGGGGPVWWRKESDR